MLQSNIISKLSVNYGKSISDSDTMYLIDHDLTKADHIVV